MNVLYITNYQGPELVRRRGIRRNRALGASAKVSRFAEGLARRGHAITVLSLGTVAERTMRAFAGFEEDALQQNAGGWRVRYLPAWDVPKLGLWLGQIQASHWIEMNARDYDVALVYNVTPYTVRTAEQLVRLGIPVVLEYEDDAGATLEAGRRDSDPAKRYLERMESKVRGGVFVNEMLRSQFASVSNAIVMPGVVPDSVFTMPRRTLREGDRMRVLYAGGLTEAKGIRSLVEAVLPLGGLVELTLTGTGPLLGWAKNVAAGTRHIRITGELPEDVLAHELEAAHVCVNPHVASASHVGTLFPFKIAEYVASGACVLSTTLPTGLEWLTSCICPAGRGEPVGIREAIQRVRHEYGEWQDKVSATRDRVKREYSLTASAASLEAVLRRALEAS